MIYVSQSVLDAMVAHALEVRPFESCGILAGSGGNVTHSYRTANAADLNGIRFEIAPKDMLRVNREIDDADLELLGIYHSHPFTRAYPSVTDVGQAWEGLVYVIVSLTDFLAPEVKAFTVADGQITEHEIDVIDDDRAGGRGDG